jgi:hypothetical protein
MGRIWLEIARGWIVATIERHVCIAVVWRDILGVSFVRIHFEGLLLGVQVASWSRMSRYM